MMMSEKEFQVIIESVRNEWTAPFETLAQATSRYWAEIELRDNFFTRLGNANVFQSIEFPPYALRSTD